MRYEGKTGSMLACQREGAVRREDNMKKVRCTREEEEEKQASEEERGGK
jgi:hypothetical protein